MRILLALTAMLALFNGCVSYEQLVNFNVGEFPASGTTLSSLPPGTIQPFDGISIAIQALDPEAVAPFNLNMAPGTAAGGAQAGGNYQVDAAGNIELPLLGTFHIAGLSAPQAREQLAARLEAYVQKPLIILRHFPQFRFTVLGEVKNPTTFTLPEDRLTILQAIGMAGDLTKGGNRENILVIRETDGQRIYGRINLRDRNIFQSPFFFIQRNDVLYVEPLKAVTTTEQATRVLPWVSSGAVLLNLIIILSTIRRN